MQHLMRKPMIFCLIIALICFGSLTLSAQTSLDKVPEIKSEALAPDDTPTFKASDYTEVTKKNETIYILMDHYGKPTRTQVVNGYHLNGASTIVDYGNYSEVTNLTNFAKPKIEGDQITWQLDAPEDNFYYQGVMEPILLPWTIDITYKLNGVETNAEKLAGASGLVETIIDLKPNKDVNDYLKNNFFLQISTSCDMGKNLSIQADDGIVVTLGDTKSVTYLTLPGETATYHLYIGSTSYENPGLNFVMAPLQASSLNEISKLKEDRDRLQGAGNAIVDSIDTICDSTSNMQEGFSSLSDGLTKMKESLNAIEAEGKANESAVDAALKQTEALNESLQKLLPHFDTAQEFVQDTYEVSNNLVTTITDLKEDLLQLREHSHTLQEDLIRLQHTANEVAHANYEMSNDLTKLGKNTSTIKSDISAMNSALSQCQNSMDEAHEQLNELKNLLSGASTLEASPDSPSTTVEALLKPYIQSMHSIISSLNTLAYTCNTSLENIPPMLDDLEDANDSLIDITSTIASGADDLDASLGDLSDTVETLNHVLAQNETLLTQIEDASHTLGGYEEECLQNLADMKDFADDSSKLLTDASTLATQVHNSATKTKGNAYESLRQTIDGTVKTLDKTIDALNTHTTIKQNTHIIQNTINNEWDRLSEDYNILDYNKDAKVTSLVSEKNKDVDSVQIILNTPEITIDRAQQLEVEKAAEEKLSLWDRILNIFKNMF